MKMIDHKCKFKIPFKALCILLALLFCLLSAGAEEGSDPVPPETADHALNETPADETPAEPDAEQVEEAAPEEAADEPEEELPDPEPDGDEDPAPAEEAVPGEDESPEDIVRYDGTLRVGTVCETSLPESKLFRLTLDRRTDLLFEAKGVAVKITITALESGLTRVWTSSATEDPSVFVISEPLTLEKGDYSVAVELRNENRQGGLSLCFSVPAAPAEEPEEELPQVIATEEAPVTESAASDEAIAPTEAQSAEAEPIEPAEPAAETAEAEAAVIETLEAEEPAEETAEADEPDMDTAEAAEPTAEAVDIPEDAASEEATAKFTEEAVDTPDAEGSAEAAAEPLTVRVLVTCDEGTRPGARIILTAVVSDPGYQGTIHWQYSPDGGQTVCDVEGAEGAEYSFLLDEVNRSYWWRAYLE